MTMQKWISHAQWPLHVYSGDVFGTGISTDTHDSESEAVAVCRGLERDGFGGQRKEFPIATWVTMQKPNAKDEQSIAGIGSRTNALGKLVEGARLLIASESPKQCFQSHKQAAAYKMIREALARIDN
jgi:hypothetical protein